MVADVIVKAIDEKRVLSIFYDGGVRKVAPCCYGNGKKGQALLRCWQISGFSRSGNVPAWKLMSVEKIQNVQILDENFNIPDGYNHAGDKAIPNVIAKI